MTQADPHTPSAGQQQEYREEFHVMGELILIIKKMWVITRKPSPGIICRVGDTA